MLHHSRPLKIDSFPLKTLINRELQPNRIKRTSVFTVVPVFGQLSQRGNPYAGNGREKQIEPFDTVKTSCCGYTKLIIILISFFPLMSLKPSSFSTTPFFKVQDNMIYPFSLSVFSGSTWVFSVTICSISFIFNTRC